MKFFTTKEKIYIYSREGLRYVCDMKGAPEWRMWTLSVAGGAVDQGSDHPLDAQGEGVMNRYDTKVLR